MLWHIYIHANPRVPLSYGKNSCVMKNDIILKRGQTQEELFRFTGLFNRVVQKELNINHAIVPCFNHANP